MKIAVPYENGEICSHLAQVKEFLIFDVVDDEIISTKIVKQTYANDPGALVEFLKKENTAVLLCDAPPAGKPLQGRCRAVIIAELTVVIVLNNQHILARRIL